MSTRQRSPVTAIILTLNEEANIGYCLESVSDLPDEIFVVDSGSTDKTIEICRKYTDRIVAHPFVDSASQWNWALNNLPIGHDWVLALDADHRLSESFKTQVRKVVLNQRTQVSGYFGRHQYLFMGSPIRGFKEYSLRLFRRSRTHLDNSELVDYRFVVDGRTAKLSGVTYEDNYNERSIDFWVDKHQKFSSRVAAEEVLRRLGLIHWTMRPRLLGNPDERVLWLKERWYASPLYVRSVLYFVYRYLLRLGFLDGRTGLFYHFMQGLWFRLLIDAKIAELKRRIGNGEMSAKDLADSFVHRF
jgi:glycosyltransferase involved in cell wall biosynthesis